MRRIRRGGGQVQSLDGGGAKELFTAAVLADLEQDHGMSITDCFDLIVGTSAGGIVALGLGAVPARTRPGSRRTAT